jgi:hypothetical protein
MLTHLPIYCLQQGVKVSLSISTTPALRKSDDWVIREISIAGAAVRGSAECPLQTSIDCLQLIGPAPENGLKKFRILRPLDLAINLSPFYPDTVHRSLRKH